MNMNSQEQPKISQTSAQAEVMGLLNNVMVMGRNDSEHSEFQKIAMALTAGTITPEEALKKVHGMMDSKQDYN
jgi:hypothetical protein